MTARRRQRRGWCVSPRRALGSLFRNAARQKKTRGAARRDASFLIKKNIIAVAMGVLGLVADREGGGKKTQRDIREHKQNPTIGF